MHYPKLFAPYRTERLELKNRIAVLPYGTAMVRDGRPTGDDLAHYVNIAKSGPGLIFTGATVVHPTSAMRNRILTEAFDEGIVESLTTKVEAIHRYDVKVFGQILHLGREWTVADADFPPMAPSPIRSPRDAYLPREMDQGDIRTIVTAFARSARHLQMAGYDGIEIHAAHGYLVAQFLSPAANHRTDEYGGSPQKRARFLLEIITAIREHCGQDIGLSVRLSADEEVVDGMEIRDTMQLAGELQQHGGVDLLSITLGIRGGYVKDMTSPPATAANAAAAIRRSCDIPVLVGQRIGTPDVAERVLSDGSADLVGMARALFADSQWIPKAARGEAHRIRPCLNFNQDCRAFSPHLHCGVNPEIGRERDPVFAELRPALIRKRIAVIGGGPGGLEFALTAARRGHDVTVFEASASFGGQFLYAASVPHREGLQRLLDHQLAELRLLGVELLAEHPVHGAEDLQASFDAAIVATGAVAAPLDAQLSQDGAIGWIDILNEGAPQPGGNGKAVFVDDGTGFWWNYGVAEALVAAGWELTFVTPSPSVGHMIPHESIAPLLGRLARGHTEFHVLSALESITDGFANIYHMTSGREISVASDLTVVHTGRTPVAGPVEELNKSGIREIHQIGDCLTPRRVTFALFEAQRIARTI